MRTTLEQYLAWVALLVQVGSYLGFARGILSDPLFVLLTLIACAVLAVWFCVSSWTDRVEEPTTVQWPDQKSLTRFRCSIKARLVGILLAVASLSILAAFCVSQGRAVFDLFESSEPVFWTQERAQSTTGDTLPVALAVGKHKLADFGGWTLAEEADNIRFSFIKRPRVPWLQVDDIWVTVEDYLEKPVGEWRSEKAPAGHPDSYLFVIDAPKSGKRRFSGRYFDVAASTLETFAGSNPLCLRDEFPKPFVLRVVARTPGVYTYTINVAVSHRWQTETKNLLSVSRRCWFQEKPLLFPFLHGITVTAGTVGLLISPLGQGPLIGAVLIPGPFNVLPSPDWDNLRPLTPKEMPKGAGPEKVPAPKSDL